MMDLLLCHGALPAHQNICGITSLMMVIMRGHLHMVDRLLAACTPQALNTPDKYVGPSI
jgi:ankyrin repeat protein